LLKIEQLGTVGGEVPKKKRGISVGVKAAKKGEPLPKKRNDRWYNWTMRGIGKKAQRD